MPAVMERNEWVDTMAHASCASRVWLETVRPKRNRISFSAPVSHKDSAFRIVVIPLTDANDSSLVFDSLEMDVLKSKIRALTAEYAQDDWDGYGAKALDPKSRTAVLRFVGRLPQSALSPDVCVDTDAEIYLEWKPRRGRYCSVTLSGDGRFRITDFGELKKGVRPRAPITKAELPAIRTTLEKDFNCIREPASWCVSDVFQACVRLLRGETSYAPGKVYGFLSRPKGVAVPTEVTAEGLRRAAAKIDLTTFLPPQIDVDGKKIGPADFLFAALEVLTAGAENVMIAPREQLGSFKEVPALETMNLAGSWLHLKEFRDIHTSERIRLQLWTLRIDRCELKD